MKKILIILMMCSAAYAGFPQYTIEEIGDEAPNWAADISDDGWIVYISSSFSQVREPNGHIINLPFYGASINNHHCVAGYDNAEAYIWHNGTIWSPDTGCLWSINDNNEMIWSPSYSGTPCAFYDSNWVKHIIGSGKIFGINNYRKVCGNNPYGSTRAFVWNLDTNDYCLKIPTELSRPAGSENILSMTAMDLNDGGMVVGFLDIDNLRGEAVVWSVPPEPNVPNEAALLKDLVVGGGEWEASYATGVNNNFEIAFSAIIDGVWHGYIARPVSLQQYTLTIQAQPEIATTITPAVGSHLYYAGWWVNLSASSFPNCPAVLYFDHWEGPVADPCSANTTVYMDGDKTVRAVYVLGERACGDLCHPVLQGDLNGDCFINFKDFALYATQWMACTHPSCDAVEP